MLTAITSEGLATADASRFLLNCQQNLHVIKVTREREDRTSAADRSARPRGSEERSLPWLLERPHCPASVRRTRCGCQPTMANDPRRESQGHVGTRGLRSLACVWRDSYIIRSCPKGWCKSGGVFALSGGFCRFHQAATAGSLKIGSSLNGAIVSRVM